MLVPEATLPFDRLVSPRARIRRERLLQGKGQVIVSPGAAVEANDVVAESQESGPVRFIDAVSALRVPPHKVEGLLQVNVGDLVEEGQLLARRGGLRRRTLTAPIAGVLTYVDERGRLLIRGEPRRHQVRALFPGQVVSVMPGQGAVIESHGAVVQGLWGNGQEELGLLRLMVGLPEEQISHTAINPGHRGTILIAGATVDYLTLESGRRAQIRGLIVGSLDAALLPFARTLPFPVMLTEGFGHYPINPSFFDLLADLDGRDGILSASDRYYSEGKRPELFVPLPGEFPEPLPPGPIAPGDRVRILSHPYLGATGRVTASSGIRYNFESGLNITGCEVRLDSGDEVAVPYANVERILQ